MKNIKEYIEDILALSKVGVLHWLGTSSISCFRTFKDNEGIILCKYYPKGSDNYVCSLSFLDSDGLLIDNRQYIFEQHTEEYKMLSDLYDNISKILKEKYEMA
ncbi:MAG: hypothetical protein V4585_17580 [Bacteroidota bacterium]